MRRDWRSDWQQPPPMPLLSQELSDRLARISASLCARCRKRVLDPLCPSCLEMIEAEERAGLKVVL